ncbi:MAG: 50S ribosomal protein L25 [Chloroflexi bacterium]|nr:50S ribosomal protein L25 [Chloroflexota bacterium]
MTSKSLALQVEPRAVTGKKVRALRRKGVTPVHLYGKGTPSMSLQAATPVLHRLIVQAGGNTPVSVSVGGHNDLHLAFIRQIQRHPVTEEILHVDLYQVPMTERMRSPVPVYLRGEAPAARGHRGIVVQALHYIEVECLPMELPQYAEVDVSGLQEVDQAIHVSSINFGPSVTILTNPDELIVRVNPLRAVVEEEAAAPAAEIAEAEVVEGAEEEPSEEDEK